MKIYSTTNYNKFQSLLGNRNVNQSHVKNLVNAIANDNLLEFNPIIVNESFEIIDGQHRLAAARYLKTPIYFVIRSSGNIDQAQTLNANLSSWKSADYLHSYVARGYEQYKILKNFSEEYKISVSISMYLLSGSNPRTGGGTEPGRLMYKFKRGEFKTTPGALEEAKKLALELNELRQYCDQPLWTDREFISALRTAYQKKPHKVLVEKLKTHGMRLRKEKGIKEYLRELEDIFNYNTQQKNRIQLYRV